MSDKKENKMEAWEITEEIRAWVIYHPNDDEYTTYLIMKDGELIVLKSIDVS